VRAGLSQASAAFAAGKHTLSAVDELEEKVRTEEDRVAAFEEESDLTRTSSAADAVAAEFDAGAVDVDAELDEMFGGGKTPEAAPAGDKAKKE
jgi:hypothetical protein